METQELCNVQVFRPRRSIRIQTAIYTALFLAVAIANVSVAFVDDPTEYGFKGKHAVEFMVAVGILFWGGWVVLGAYALLSYHVEQVTIDGSRIARRSTFQHFQFDVAEVISLAWKLAPVGGRLVFSTQHDRTKLDLYAYSESDRLRLIRQFRTLIPEDKQAGWRMFCHKLAVPLVDRLAIRDARETPLAVRGDEVLITRRRYDRMAAVAIPATLAIAGVVSWLTKLPTPFAIPACLTVFWLFVRFHVRPEGEVHSRLLGQPGGHAMLISMSLFVVAGVVAVVSRAVGYSSETGCTFGLVILAPMLPIVIVGMLRAERQRKLAAEVESLHSLERWNASLA